MNAAMLLTRLSDTNAISRVVLGISEEMAAQGHKVTIYSSFNTLSPATLAGLRGKISLRWLPCFTGSWRIWSMPAGALRPYLHGHDLVVSHALTVKQDVVVMHNDPQPVELQKLSAVPFTLEKPRLSSRNRAIRTSIERLRFRPGNYRRIIASSARSAKEIETSMGVPREKISAIPLGVDSVRFSPEQRAARRGPAREKAGLAADRPVFLYLGDSWKGLEFAIRGLGGIKKAGPVLVAAGSFNSDIFKAFAAACGVEFLAGFPISDIRDFYALGDAFLSPTPMDTFGMAALEAAAMGLPVVLSRCAGASELFSDGESALLLETPHDPREITRAAERLLRPEERERLGGGAARVARANGWAAVARRHMEVYGEIFRV